MDLELADYQRSMASLEGELTSREERLQEVVRESHTHQETAQQLQKDIGKSHWMGCWCHGDHDVMVMMMMSRQ